MGLQGQHLPEALWAMMPLSAEEWRDLGPEMGSLRECLGAGYPHFREGEPGELPSMGLYRVGNN